MVVRDVVSISSLLENGSAWVDSSVACLNVRCVDGAALCFQRQSTASSGISLGMTRLLQLCVTLALSRELGRRDRSVVPAAKGVVGVA